MSYQIKLVCCDVDGTLTDGKINIGPQGEIFKSFCVKDGLGIALAKDLGVKFAFITGRRSEITEFRARELGIEEVYQGVRNKRDIVEKLKAKYQLDKDEVAYLGDDINDVVVKSAVGLFAVVGDGHPQAKNAADFVLESNGGEGAMRELLDRFVLGQSIEVM